MRACAGSLVAVAVVLGGCLPARDNPHDPANAPLADLFIADVTTASGCPSPGAVVAPEPIASVFRDRCIALIASGSQNESGDGSGLTYRFARVDSSGGVVTDFSANEGVDDALPVYVLSPDEVLALALGEVLTFRVRVSDGGAFGFKTATLVVANRAPVAVPGPPRTLRLGGNPWAHFQPYQVAFDGSGSTDPDDIGAAGEKTYCWTFDAALAPAGACALTPDPELGLCSTDPRHACFTRSIASVLPAGAAARLVVVDAEGAASDPALTRVVIGEQNVWAWDPGVPKRLDTRARTFAFPDYEPIVNGNYAMALFDPPGEPVQVLVAYSSANLSEINVEVGDWPDVFIDDSEAEVLGPFAEEIALATDPVNQKAYALVEPGYVTRYSVGSGTVSAEAFGEVFAVGWESFDTIPRFMEADAGGSLFIAKFGTSGVHRLASAHTATPPWSESSWSPTIANPVRLAGMARNPVTGEVWTVHTSAPGVAGGEAMLVRHALDGSVEEMPLGVSFAYGLAWVDEHRFWTVLPDMGLVLADAREQPLSPLLAVDTAADARFLKADPVTGECWAATGTRADAIRASIDGRSERFDGASFEPMFVDPVGAIWFLSRRDGFAKSFHRGSVPVSGRPVASAGAQPLFLASADLETGGVWIATETPRGVVRVAEDGGVLDRFDTWVVDGVESPIPAVLAFEPEPGGTSAWAWTGAAPEGEPLVGMEIFRVDLSVRPPIAVEVDDLVLYEALSELHPLFLASSPGATGTPFVWRSYDTDADFYFELVRLFADGQTSVTDLGLDTLSAAARSLESSSLCTLLVEPGGSPPQTHTTRWFDAATGAGTTLFSWDPASPSVGTGAASVSYDTTGGEICWVAAGRYLAGVPDPCGFPDSFETRVVASRVSDGVEIADVTIPDALPLSLVATGPDTFLLQSQRCFDFLQAPNIYPYDLRRFRVQFFASAVELDAQLDNGAFRLIAPESSPF